MFSLSAAQALPQAAAGPRARLIRLFVTCLIVMAATLQTKGESGPCLLETIGSITLIDFALRALSSASARGRPPLRTASRSERIANGKTADLQEAVRLIWPSQKNMMSTWIG